MAPGLQHNTSGLQLHPGWPTFHQTRLQTRHPGGEVFRLTYVCTHEFKGDLVKQLVYFYTLESEGSNLQLNSERWLRWTPGVPLPSEDMVGVLGIRPPSFNWIVTPNDAHVGRKKRLRMDQNLEPQYHAA